MSFSHELRERAADVWEAQHEHPFVRGIGDGTLDLERFGVWVRQDYLYLVEYARMLAFGTAKAPDPGTMRKFAELTRETLVTEMDLHRSYCGRLGIGEADLEAERMLPTTRAYTDFLVAVASQRDFSELVAALLPCMWCYAEVGERLAAAGRPGVPHYDEWIEMYSSAEFHELAAWCRELTDRIGADAGEETRAHMHQAFLLSSRYELDFWEMAWTAASPPTG